MSVFRLNVNGNEREVDVVPETPLLHVLRNRLGLRGTKFGCGLEQCGACAVLVDGVSRMSCTMPVSVAEGRSVTTVEGLAENGRLSRVQQAFIDASAAQCGYCTPGLLIAVTALFTGTPQPAPDDIAEALESHLCRCGAQPRVLEAIRLLQESAAW